MSKVLTSADMFNYVLGGINKELNGSLEDSEFEELINGSQMKTVTTLAEEVEAGQRPIDDLRSILKEETLIPTDVVNNRFDFENAGVSANGVLVVKAPAIVGQNGYLRMLSGKVKFDFKDNKCYPDGIPSDDKPYAWMPLKPMKSDKLFSTPRDYYNRPTDDRPYWQLKSVGVSGTVMEIINNAPSRAYRVVMQYLVHPRTILLANNTIDDMDIPIHLRQTVCETAIRVYLERIESQRTRSVIQEQQLNIQ